MYFYCKRQQQFFSTKTCTFYYYNTRIILQRVYMYCSLDPLMSTRCYVIKPSLHFFFHCDTCFLK